MKNIRRQRDHRLRIQTEWQKTRHIWIAKIDRLTSQLLRSNELLYIDTSKGRELANVSLVIIMFRVLPFLFLSFFKNYFVSFKTQQHHVIIGYLWIHMNVSLLLSLSVSLSLLYSYLEPRPLTRTLHLFLYSTVSSVRLRMYSIILTSEEVSIQD